jgi:hypothetical protein
MDGEIGRVLTDERNLGDWFVFFVFLYSGVNKWKEDLFGSDK